MWRTNLEENTPNHSHLTKIQSIRIVCLNFGYFFCLSDHKIQNFKHPYLLLQLTDFKKNEFFGISIKSSTNLQIYMKIKEVGFHGLDQLTWNDPFASYRLSKSILICQNSQTKTKVLCANAKFQLQSKWRPPLLLFM